jgi:nucleolar protein 56
MQHFHHLSGEYAIDGDLVQHIVSVSREDATSDPLDERTLNLVMQEVRKHASVAMLHERNIARTKRAVSASVSPDQLIVITINTIEELDKITNTLAKRLRDIYGLYDPELEHNTPEHPAFIVALLASAPRAQGTMGGAFTDEDLRVTREQAERIRGLYAQREQLLAYLDRLMQEHTPNLKRVAGSMIGGKLIALAGSMRRLSSMPAGTVQLLGAETALFRHLRNRSARPPKHGIIFNHVLLQRAPQRLRGKAARVIADKTSIAAKVDYFKGEYCGDTLYAEMERRIAAHDKK